MNWSDRRAVVKIKGCPLFEVACNELYAGGGATLKAMPAKREAVAQGSSDPTPASAGMALPVQRNMEGDFPDDGDETFGDLFADLSDDGESKVKKEKKRRRRKLKKEKKR